MKFCLSAASLLLAGFTLYAQSFTGSIRGRVTDPGGLPVPQADITVVENATQETAKTVSDSSGDYAVSFLKPGVYNVTFALQGFKTVTETGLSLSLNQNFRLDKTMEVGSVADSVEVAATPTDVDYGSPEIAHVVSQVQLENLPEIVNPGRGRSPLLLAKLVPGVTSTSGNNSNINNFSFGGGRPVTNEILEDGLPTTNPSDNTYTFTPSPDSVDEFKAITSPFSAEFGHTGGGVLLLTSKHGTNELHGSLYDYFRNRVLNARSFFQSTNKTRYIQNDPGFTLGGPVILPHYNGRNKTFFFADYNVTVSAVGTAYQQLVPTAQERSGDFSQSGSTIYDPATTSGNSKNFTRTPFPGNIIPSNRIDPVGAKIASFYPNPTGNYGSFNYQVNPTDYHRISQGLIRVDHNFSDNDKMFMRYGRYSPNEDAKAQIPGPANNHNANGWWDNQAAFSETHIFSPRVFSEFRAGFIQEINYELAAGPAVPQLGLKGVSLDAFPDINTSNFPQLGGDGKNSDRDRSWVFTETLEIQKGRHTMKIGGDFRRQMYNFYNPGLLAGTYGFDNAFTAIPTDKNSGFDLADMLLGLPSDSAFNIEDYTYRENINSASVYFQDDFKVNPRLTLNLGLRWEFDGPYSEANNQFASFNPKLINATTGTPGEMQFAGRGGAPSHFMPNIYHDFLPRVGMAWNVARNTVFRAGIAFYRQPNIGFNSAGPLSKYVQNADFQSLDGITPRIQLSQGIPNIPYFVDANGNPSVPASLTNPTSSVNQIDTRIRTPYNINWQAGLERQFGSWFAEIDYAANRGVKLPIVIGPNQLRPDQFATGDASLRPFPQYAAVSYLTMDGNSVYHSLQAKLERRWNNGLIISAAYTFSKLIDDVDPPSRVHNTGVQNVYDLRAERGLSGYDIPHRFVANYVYALPFGRGGKVATETPIVRDIIAHWELAGLTEFQSGQVVNITQPNHTHGFTQSQRPNIVGDPVLSNGKTIQHWFNTAAFQIAPDNTLGDSPRFPFHGPGINNWDLALQRNFFITERLKFQFRGEFFDAFNHPQFDVPVNNVASKNFGALTKTLNSRVVEVALRLFF